MGGQGSGRRPKLNRGGRRLIADRDALRLDLKDLHRESVLLNWGVTTVTWSLGNGKNPSIAMRFDPDREVLSLEYRIGNWKGEREPITQQVPISFMDCTYGGCRPWFHCPACGRRCRVLWGAPIFQCRSCLRILYASQNELTCDRARRRISILQRQLETDAFTDPTCIPRPRYMRYDRYRRLIFELASQEALRSVSLMNLVTRAVTDLNGWEGEPGDGLADISGQRNSGFSVGRAAPDLVSTPKAA